MIEELITRSLIVVFGYAYPAYQCFKTLEKNKVGIPELRFWCQYWVIVAIFSVLERFLDIFVSWIPFYRAIKLVMYIFLWHPGTKGSSYIYDTVVQPFVSKHESKIDRGIAELKERVWNLALDYWYKSAHMSSKKVLECLQLLMLQCMNAALSRPQSQDGGEAAKLKRTDSEKPRSTSDKNISKSDSIKLKSNNQAQSTTPTQDKSETDSDILNARVKLRRVSNKE